MSEGKWISGLRADMGVADAACHALKARLEPVRDRLPKAVHKADEDPEHVHQLRVGTRRAAAALRTFADCLPKKVLKKARKSLRKVRRAAGAARDWDVFLATIWERHEGASAGERPGLDFLVGAAEGMRMTAQQALVETSEESSLDFDAVLHGTIDSLQTPKSLSKKYTLCDLAVPIFSDELRCLEEAAGADLTDYKKLHQVRIQGKRLRYAMEIFACCFAREFRDQLYPTVEEMQELLGVANDSHVALEHLQALQRRAQEATPMLWKRYRRGVAAIIRFHERTVTQNRKAFERWWRAWKKGGTEAEFLRLLK